MRVGYRFSTAADIRAFFGDDPIPTMRAITITLADEPAGLIGVARLAACGWYFSECKPELEPHIKSVAILRAIKKSITIIESSSLPVLAVAGNEQSPALLMRLGFEPCPETDGEVWWWSARLSA